MFIGRKKELQALQEVYEKPGFGMMVVYGRRRVGKSTLIHEFVKGKKTIYYMATRVGRARNLELFARRVTAALGTACAEESFEFLEDVFTYIGQKLGDEKVVLVIDELPCWAEKDDALLSVMQCYIDTDWQDKNLMVILCGSSLRFMEQKVLGEKSPLFGRRDGQIRLEAFHYRDAAAFVPHYTLEEKAICYGITGGVAKYLSMLDDTRTLDDNIKRLFFRTDGYLYDETHNLLMQEFDDFTLVNNIMELLAEGEIFLNSIADKMGENPVTVFYSLEKLISIGLVEKRRCITEEKNRKKTRYVLKDTMFKFWYTFLPGATSVIEMGQGSLYYDNYVKQKLYSFMEDVFAQMCSYYTLEQGVAGRFGSVLTNMGYWWGSEIVVRKDGVHFREARRLDIVGVSEADKTAVIGACMFRRDRMGQDAYEELVHRGSLISGQYRVTRCLLFSLGGYTGELEGMNSKNLMCFTLEDLYREP